MSLDLESLKTNIYDILSSMVSDDLPDEAKADALSTIEALSNNLSEAINTFVKSGDYVSNDESESSTS